MGILEVHPTAFVDQILSTSSFSLLSFYHQIPFEIPCLFSWTSFTPIYSIRALKSYIHTVHATNKAMCKLSVK